MNGQFPGGGPRIHVGGVSMPPPPYASAWMMVLCEMEIPNPSTGGEDSGVGDPPNTPRIPPLLQSDDQSYSPSTRFPRISSPAWKNMRLPHRGQLGVVT